MQIEKFKSEVATLKKFFELYCHDHHDNRKIHQKQLLYKNETVDVNLELCDECMELLQYSFDRLLECPHDPKPMCRSCPNPCYEKPQWKKVAKLMRYSGMQLGLLKVKRFIKNMLSK